jgi:hypothetical protein
MISELCMSVRSPKVSKARKMLLSLTLVGALQQTIAGQSVEPKSPPMILDLGSNSTDGSVTITCVGDTPYSKVSCRVYRLWINRPSIEEYQNSRNGLQKELTTKSEQDLMKMRQSQCSRLQSVSSDLAANVKRYSPGRAASAQDGYEQMKAICGCSTKQCITSTMLEQQTHEQNECTVRSVVFPADFVKVSGYKWVSNNGPEGLCGAVSVFTIEREAGSEVLWTYTEQYTYTNNTEGFCKGLASSETAIYSWKAGSVVRLRCENIKFSTMPE